MRNKSKRKWCSLLERNLRKFFTCRRTQTHLVYTYSSSTYHVFHPCWHIMIHDLRARTSYPNRVFYDRQISLFLNRWLLSNDDVCYSLFKLRGSWIFPFARKQYLPGDLIFNTQICRKSCCTRIFPRIMRSRLIKAGRSVASHWSK